MVARGFCFGFFFSLYERDWLGVCEFWKEKVMALLEVGTEVE